MFLEKVGRLLFSKTRPLFFYLFLSTPVLCACGYLFSQKMRLDELEQSFLQSCKKSKIAIERKQGKEKFLQRYSHATPYFLDHQIESLPFLQREKKELKALVEHPAFSEKRMIEERLRFIEGDENRLAFIEEAIRDSSQMKEAEEKQRHPVQMDEEDLKKLLCLIEDVPIDSFSPLENSPQIVIADFQFEKKESPLKTKFLEVEMKLLKREIKK